MKRSGGTGNGKIERRRNEEKMANHQELRMVRWRQEGAN